MEAGAMNRKRATLFVVLFVVFAGVLLAVVPGMAHHAFNSEFDANKPVVLRGTITKLEWINPHSWIHVDVRKPDGTVEAWMVEAGTPNTLLRRGITKTTLIVGTEVTIEGFQSKDGALRANGRDMVLPNGQKLFMANPEATGAPGEKP
jgi:hypothetical protein